MKAYVHKDNPFYLILTCCIIIALLQACSSTRYIGPNQAIVTKVKIDSITPAFQEQAYNYVQKEIRPTSKLGINVMLYNIFNTKNGRYKTSGIKDIGTPPAIIDSTLVEISRVQIEKFLHSKGYFKAKVGSDISVSNKRAKITFTAAQGPGYIYNKISYAIPDTAVKRLYLTGKQGKTQLFLNHRYDEDSLDYERELIYGIMRRNGYYDFSRPYITYDVDTNLTGHRINLLVRVASPKDSAAHKIYRYGTMDLIIAPGTRGFANKNNYKLNDTLSGHIRYSDFSHRYHLSRLRRYIFLNQGDKYNLDMENLTYDRLYHLNVFKGVKIDYNKNPDSTHTLNPVIQLVPQKQMSNRIEGEVPFNSGTIGFNISNTFVHNNLFKGAERFEFQVKGGLQARGLNNEGFFKDIYQRDFAISANLAVPKLLVPFADFNIGKNGIPHTTFSSSYVFALQKDVVKRQVFLNSITYDWSETLSKLHSFTPLNFEYRLGSLLLPEEDIANGRYSLYNLNLLSRKDFTLGMKYVYTLNADKLLQQRSFFYLRAGMEMAGNLVYALARISGNKPDIGNNRYATIFGLPFNQYVLPDVDFRWYKSFGTDRFFVARLNTGVGYAYGNSRDMPFEKLFFAGGATGVRAWQARTLGPGNYNRQSLTEDDRKSFYGLDQLGQMRIESNFEYRFNIARSFIGGKLNGAAFIDAGNIWNFKRDSFISAGNVIVDDSRFFNWSKLGRQIAIGTGAGLRYDVKFFVVRFDVGLKVKDPQFGDGDQWVIGKLFNGYSTFKENYNQTHSPDKYRFLQYNFGIGLPF